MAQVQSSPSSSGLLRLFGVTFVAIFVAELGDKTQLATLTFAAQTPAFRYVIFAAAAGALVLSALVGVLVGDLLGRLVKPRILNVVAGFIFLVCAALFVWRFFGGGGEPDSAESVAAAASGRTPWETFVFTFLAIFFAELGDKTQLATLSLAAGNRHARWIVFGGSSLALVSSSILAAVLGGLLGDRLHSPYIALAAAAIFAVLGVLFLFGRATKGEREFAWLVEQIDRLYGDRRCGHCPRFMRFLSHIEAIGSDTVSEKVRTLRLPAEQWTETPSDCSECRVDVLHEDWHQRHDHEDAEAFDPGGADSAQKG